MPHPYSLGDTATNSRLLHGRRVQNDKLTRPFNTASRHTSAHTSPSFPPLLAAMTLCLPDLPDKSPRKDHQRTRTVPQFQTPRILHAADCMLPKYTISMSSGLQRCKRIGFCRPINTTMTKYTKKTFAFLFLVSPLTRLARLFLAQVAENVELGEFESVQRCSRDLGCANSLAIKI